MAKDTLLKEAIADAKAVKEAAIANAMLTLKESFKPQLTSMLAAKLRNESDDNDADDQGGEEVSEQNTLKSSELGGKVNVDNPGPKNPSHAASDSSDIENKGQETDELGDTPAMSGKTVNEDLPLPPEGGEGPMGGGDEMGGQDEFGGEEDDMNGDGLDLEAIIRELEADLMGGQQGGGDVGGEDQFGGEKELGQENFTQAHDGQNPMAARQVVRTETVPGNAGDGIEHDGKAASAVDGVNGGKEVQPGAEQGGDEFGTKDFSKAKGSVDEEVNLDEILREMEAENSTNESETIAAENVELKRSLKEHREVIQLLRSRINEVTLLNSKLMFTTKIFRKFNLTEDQKKKVVEQLDRATTLREAKIVFTTLAETITNRMGSAGMKKSAARITESASSPIGSTKPKSTTVLSEGREQVARLQKLAGIKPTNIL